MQVYLKIKDKETGMVSEPIPIEDVIFNQSEIEFDFKEDETSLPYNDFLFYRDDYEGIVVIKEEE